MDENDKNVASSALDTVQTALVIATLCVSVYSLGRLGRDLGKAGIEKIQTMKTKKQN